MTTDYQIWLTANGEKEKLMLPVNPSTFSVKCGSNHDSVDIVSLGEITIMQGRPALQINFSSFFPATYFPGCKTRNPTAPISIIKKIKAWQASDKPVHLIATQCGVDMYCTIEDFPHSESGGDVGTYEYSLKLKEYRATTIRQVKVTIPKTPTEPPKAEVPKPAPPRVDNTVTPKTYTVKRGDCLWNIAKKFYGNGAKYMKIYNANKDKIKNPNLIYTGQVLTIPDA